MKIVTTIILGITAWAGAQTLPAPVLAYPADGAKDVTVYATLKWKKVAGATGYHAQIATDLGFTAMFLEDSVLADTSIKMNKFADSTSYYWRVRTRNAAGFFMGPSHSGFSVRPAQGSGIDVEFTLAARSAAKIVIADLEGRTMGVVTGRMLEAGAHRTRALAGSAVPGVYLVRLEASGMRQVRRVVLP